MKCSSFLLILAYLNKDTSLVNSTIHLCLHQVESSFIDVKTVSFDCKYIDLLVNGNLKTF